MMPTAVITALGLPDDCRELEILRWYRDTYMQDTPSRRAEVYEYYRIAPLIVEKIEQSDSGDSIWRNIYARYLVPAVSAIKHGKKQKAHRIYREMVGKLAEEWLGKGYR